MLPLKFRPMTIDDLPFVMCIENAVYPFPWTEDIIYNCIRLQYECWVVLENNEIVGYAIMSIAANECHVLNLCIATEAQRKKSGAALLLKMIEVVRHKAVTRILLEVRVSNQIAYHLYTQNGFTIIGQRKDYYPTTQGREDALVLELLITKSHVTH